ncbi:DUF6279 family lipoprotein [Pseudomonas mangrovi]|uniref:Lipoprotein n=1 Tax=Pseudomonas mangrovi TaxID=2161748 RepID=A0A2T5PC77_9PSED|nr:DUF6279 family lipoprotein [Pseudomonas mangrovi]PTU75358.1 hypothetical protein DBO85_04230 [Pseudomonas mangrovi]
MTPRSSDLVRALLLGLAASLLLTLVACSRVGLAYRNLDMIIPWSLDDYLQMSDEQRAFFDERLDEHLLWHCSQELPRYRDWLASLQQMSRSEELDPQQMQARFDEAREAIDAIARQITPTTIELLRDLDDAQVRQLEEALRKDIDERRKEHLQPPVSEQIADRAERMEKRLATWYGRLTQAQKARVRQWSEALGNQNQQWIDNRAQWHARLLQTLQTRDQADFPERISALMQQRQQYWTPEYRRIFAAAEVQARELLRDVHLMAEPRQRAHLHKRLDDLQRELAEIPCQA